QWHAGDLSISLLPGGRGLDELWYEPRRIVAPSRRLRRTNPEGRQAGRPPGPAGDQTRAGDQHEDRQDARPRNSTHAPGPRRRGDRIKLADYRYRRISSIMQSIGAAAFEG